MKILVVEDDRDKRLHIEYVFEKENIHMQLFRSIRPAIRYAMQHSNEISGIILDLGLTSYDNSDDYEFEKGLQLIYELTENSIDIPILINSGTYVNVQNLMRLHSNVKDQMHSEDDYTTLRWFIQLLKEKEQ